MVDRAISIAFILGTVDLDFLEWKIRMTAINTSFLVFHLDLLWRERFIVDLEVIDKTRGELPIATEFILGAYVITHIQGFV